MAKNKFNNNGVELDLSYITDGLIVMGFPAEGIEGIYRNPMKAVQHLFKTEHPNGVRVYSFCAERSYPSGKFESIRSVPIEDGAPPCLSDIRPFCEDVHSWLEEDEENVVALHCKHGLARSGVMACCYLLYSQQFVSATQALQYFSEKRKSSGEAVVIPSQRRYVGYFQHLLSKGFLFPKEPIYYFLTEVNLNSVPNLEKYSNFILSISTRGKTVYFVKECRSHGGKKGITFDCEGFLMTEDVKFTLFDKNTENALCWFWLHANFLGDTVQIPRTHLDLGYDGVAKAHETFKKNFKILLHFDSKGEDEFTLNSVETPPNAYCHVCNEEVRTNTPYISNGTNPEHWSCVKCEICGYSFDERDEIIINTSRNGRKICRECDLHILKGCARCGTVLSSNISPNIDGIGLLCRACFHCALCMRPFLHPKEEDFDSNIDLWDIAGQRLVCKIHTESSKKIIERQEEKRIMRENSIRDTAEERRIERVNTWHEERNEKVVADENVESWGEESWSSYESENEEDGEGENIRLNVKWGDIEAQDDQETVLRRKTSRAVGIKREVVMKRRASESVVKTSELEKGKKELSHTRTKSKTPGKISSDGKEIKKSQSMRFKKKILKSPSQSKKKDEVKVSSRPLSSSTKKTFSSTRSLRSLSSSNVGVKKIQKSKSEYIKPRTKGDDSSKKSKKKTTKELSKESGSPKKKSKKLNKMDSPKNDPSSPPTKRSPRSLRKNPSLRQLARHSEVEELDDSNDQMPLYDDVNDGLGTIEDEDTESSSPPVVSSNVSDKAIASSIFTTLGAISPSSFASSFGSDSEQPYLPTDPGTPRYSLLTPVHSSPSISNPFAGLDTIDDKEEARGHSELSSSEMSSTTEDEDEVDVEGVTLAQSSEGEMGAMGEKSVGKNTEASETKSNEDKIGREELLTDEEEAPHDDAPPAISPPDINLEGTVSVSDVNVEVTERDDHVDGGVPAKSVINVKDSLRVRTWSNAKPSATSPRSQRTATNCRESIEKYISLVHSLMKTTHKKELLEAGRVLQEENAKLSILFSEVEGMCERQGEKGVKFVKTEEEESLRKHVVTLLMEKKKMIENMESNETLGEDAKSSLSDGESKSNTVGEGVAVAHLLSTLVAHLRELQAQLKVFCEEEEMELPLKVRHSIPPSDSGILAVLHHSGTGANAKTSTTGDNGSGSESKGKSKREWKDLSASSPASSPYPYPASTSSSSPSTSPWKKPIHSGPQNPGVVSSAWKRPINSREHRQSLPLASSEISFKLSETRLRHRENSKGEGIDDGDVEGKAQTQTQTDYPAELVKAFQLKANQRQNRGVGPGTTQWKRNRMSLLRVGPKRTQPSKIAGSPIPFIGWREYSTKPLCRGCSKKIVDFNVAKPQESSYHVEIGGVSCYFHPEHFTCTLCDKVIKKNEDFVVQEGVNCMDCYTSHYATKCLCCKKHITGEFREVEDVGHYHVDCFKCKMCDKLLGEEMFVLDEELPVCQNCISE